ncbi:MAG: ExeM/NucH family extracellular endonuclease [Pseudomonadota bacterium]
MGYFWQRYFVFGTFCDDELFGTVGRDFIFGFRGNDWINPGAGNDFVFAGRGNDTILGSAGSDFIHGGRGFDTVRYEGRVSDYDIQTEGRGWWSSTTVTSTNPDVADAGRDRLKKVEALYFAADDYTLFLDGTNNAVLAGDDAASTDEDTPLALSVADLLANDQEFDGDAIQITGVESLTTGVSVTLVDGQIIYDAGTTFDSLAAGMTATDTFTYTVGDGKGGVDTATVTITITGLNDAPDLTVDTAVTVDENTLQVPANIAASDVDAGAILTFSITGGDDAAAFTIDADTGALSFITAPDFEAPTDAGADNIYDLQVGVSDGIATTTADIAVTVADVLEIDARINEFHYDNSGTDVGEFVEVRVGEGQDATRLTVELYNGNGGAVYSTLTLPDTPQSTTGGFDYYLIKLPANGIQNGPDGIALSNNGTLIEFLSYEGTFTGVGGAADGVASTDIGVAENGSTPVGAALERDEAGDGWSVTEEDTRGLNNDTVILDDPLINEFVFNHTGADDDAFIEILGEANSDYSNFWLLEVEGDGGGAGSIDAAIQLGTTDANGYFVDAEDAENGTVSLLLVEGFTGAVGDDLDADNDGAIDATPWARIVDSVAVTDGGADDLTYGGVTLAPDFDGGTFTVGGASRTPNGEDSDSPADWVGNDFSGAGLPGFPGVEADAGEAINTPGADNAVQDGGFVGRINEFHYDNAGGDVGEFIEVRVEAGSVVSGASIELYNGNGGGIYNTVALSTGTQSTDGTFVYYVLDIAGIQNGSPDGIALINDGSVLEFLSYEGSFTATNGTASGLTSTDIGVSEPGDTPIGLSLQRADDGSWFDPLEETPGAANNTPAIPFEGRINEFHYDNDGGDVGEFIEVRVNTGASVESAFIELYNGNGGGIYNTLALSDATKTTAGAFDYYMFNLPTNGLQNGSPDGLALINDGAVVEFLSYEGSLTATNGTAAGLTSTDIGVSEPGSTPVGFSLQRNADGTWRAPEAETRGAANTPAAALVLNEIALTTTGPDWEFVEIFGDAGASLDGKAIIQVGGTGDVLTVIDLAGLSVGADGYFLAASPEAETEFSLSPADVDLSFVNGSFNNTSSTFLLVDGLSVAEGADLDTDDDGTFDVTGFAGVIDSVALVEGDATGIFAYSDTVVTDPSFPPAGAQRLPNGTGEFEITDFNSSAGYTPGAENLVPPAETKFIWEVQGSGMTSALVGEAVIVEAVVTYSVSNGFFLQEEDADADGDSATSDGIFVFTGGLPTVSLGDRVSVEGTVTEFFNETQINNAAVTIVSSGNSLPTPGQLGLSDMTTDAQKEALEGMLFTLSSGIVGEEITISENFNLDRFGSISVSAGVKTQATQTFEPGSPEALAVIAGNANNSLTIDDGFSGQNPTEFAYIPNTTAGDNGNGILDAGDSFAADGPTLRLGTTVGDDATGVMRFQFGEYTMLVDGTLDLVDSNPRPESPASQYQGDLQVGAFNVLNYFTTFSGQTITGVGVRGADNQNELDRQTEKLVNAMLQSEVDVFALQEIENGGFAEGSAIDALTDALNAQTVGTPFAFVDPTDPATNGAIGTDAITTGIIYDSSKVSLLNSDFVVFEEASAQITFDLAADLAAAIGQSNPVGDFQRNRPMVVATFEDDTTGDVFTVASVHFKSKGPSGLGDLIEDGQAFVDANPADTAAADALAALQADPNVDQGDGAGFWNQVRADAANEAYAFLTTQYDVLGDGSQFGTQDYLLTGDFNAYTQEAPVQDVAGQSDTTDLLDTFIGPDAYSFVFDGQRGALDQAIAGSGLSDDVAGVFEWHINADEPDLLNYDDGFNDTRFYENSAYASSDHDPLIIDLRWMLTEPDQMIIA